MHKRAFLKSKHQEGRGLKEYNGESELVQSILYASAKSSQ
jgi:hypothetical protein